MVDFLGSYHAILGQPCYAKFMAIPNYTYLKLKMPGPNDVIIVGRNIRKPLKVQYQIESQKMCFQSSEGEAP